MNLADIEAQKVQLTANYQRYMAALDSVAELLGATGVVQSKPENQAKPGKEMAELQPKGVAKNGNGSAKARIIHPANRTIPAARRSTEQIAEIVAGMKSPFTTDDFMKASGMDNGKTAFSSLTRLIARKVITRAGKGVYALAAKKGDHKAKNLGEQLMNIIDRSLQATEPKSHKREVTLPFDAPTGMSLEAKLADAKAEWLKAHQAGKTTLEQILADKVKNLEARIVEQEAE